MHIVCPHCTTSYAIQLSSLSSSGQTLRCSRCRQIWIAYPDASIEEASIKEAHGTREANSQPDPAEEWDFDVTGASPLMDSPITSNDGLAMGHIPNNGKSARTRNPSWFRRLFRRRNRTPQTRTPPGASHALRSGAPKNPLSRNPASRKSAWRKPKLGLPACAAMAVLMAALIVWRANIVRVLPQTASFYKMAGFDVNLRGLAFKDVKFTTETADGKIVWVIEGVIVDKTGMPTDIPHLHFSVRDAQGAEIYAWNTALEQSVLKPGERAFFKSRLASPPPEGRNIDIRFLNPRDVAGGV